MDREKPKQPSHPGEAEPEQEPEPEEVPPEQKEPEEDPEHVALWETPVSAAELKKFMQDHDLFF